MSEDEKKVSMTEEATTLKTQVQTLTEKNAQLNREIELLEKNNADLRQQVTTQKPKKKSFEEDW